MANAVLMPKAGITVESCIIGKWQKKVGDRIALGDILFNYETDKATFECESTAEGELLEIFFHDGDEVPCLVNVCAIGEKGEDVSALRPAAESAPGEGAKAEASAASAYQAEDLPAQSMPGAPVSPRAKKLAERAGVDAAAASGTGPHGRVIERDVRRLMEQGAPAPAAAAPDGDGEYEDVKFSGIRKVISRSMHTSLQNMAQLTHMFSFDASAILAYRKQVKAAGGEYGGITIGDMVLYAVTRTLVNYPDLNAHMLDDVSIRRFRHVNLGVAVDTPRGLMVPTVFRAEEKSLLQISQEVKVLAQEARGGAISPDKLTGGTFTVTNLGSLGVEAFTPVINPPQTGILGVCGTVDRPRRSADGGIELYPAMGLSLTYDHRAIDGAPASRFMQELCRNLEQFTMLLAQ